MGAAWPLSALGDFLVKSAIETAKYAEGRDFYKELAGGSSGANSVGGGRRARNIRSQMCSV